MKYQLVIEDKRKHFIKGCWGEIVLVMFILGFGIAIAFSPETAMKRLSFGLILLFMAMLIIKYLFVRYQYNFHSQWLIIEGNTIMLSTILYLEPWAFFALLRSDKRGMVKLTLSDPRVMGWTKRNGVLRLRESVPMGFSAITADGKTHVWNTYEMRNLHYRDEKGERKLLSDILIETGFVEKIEPYDHKEIKIDLFEVKRGCKDMVWMAGHLKEIRELNLGPMSGPGIPRKGLEESVSEMKKKISEKQTK